MVGWILKKILGNKNTRELKRLAPIVRRINEFDDQFKSLSDEELRAKTAAWKEELANIPQRELLTFLKGCFRHLQVRKEFRRG